MRSISFNQNHSFIVDEAGAVYSFGMDDHGQLGRGEYDDLTVCPYKGNTATKGKRCRVDIGKVDLPVEISSLHTGYNHTLAIGKDGNIYAWGDNSKGQLGKATTEQLVSTPIKIELPASLKGKFGKPVQVKASSSTSYALDDKGQVWAWGGNKYNNLGQGADYEDSGATPVLVKMPNDTKIIKIAVGRDHVLAQDKDGKVYSWGLGASGQLGISTAHDEATATAIPYFSTTKASNIYANGNTSIASLANGTFVNWGMRGVSKQGQSFPDWERNPTSQKPMNIKNVSELAMGGLHQIGKFKDGSVFGLGWSFEGSMGNPDVAERWIFNDPVAVTIPSN